MPFLESIFGAKKTPQQLLRQHQRALTRAMRDLDKEKSKLEQQEKKLLSDIKKMAQGGQMDAAKIMAKDLVRTRRYVKKFIMMKAQIQAVSLKIQTLRSTQAMAEAMKGVTKAMKSMNARMNLPEIQKIMMEFEKESEIMDMKEEMMNDTIDDVMGDAEDDEESDLIVNKVLDEIGISLNQTLVDAPQTKTPAAAQPVAAGKAAVADSADADLQARLDNLRRD
eukprot:Opistho-2@80960